VYGSAFDQTMKVTLHFPREFNAQSFSAQQREFAQHLSTAVAGMIERLDGRGLDYDFRKMQRDFKVTLQSWLKTRWSPGARGSWISLASEKPEVTGRIDIARR